jgi:hypothetical protein
VNNYNTPEARQELCDLYAMSLAELEPYDVLFSYYDVDGYSGSSFELLRRRSDGRLFENEGGHCSCFGLEDQFAPGESCKEHLLACFGPKSSMPFWTYYKTDEGLVAEFRAIVEAL